MARAMLPIALFAVLIPLCAELMKAELVGSLEVDAWLIVNTCANSPEARVHSRRGLFRKCVHRALQFCDVSNNFQTV